MKKLVLLGLVVLVLGAGCTRSLDVAYQADAARLSNSAALEKVTVGVAKFEDRRAWVEKGNPKSESYVALQGPWKFGLTYKEVDYTPVKDVLQDLLVQELTKAGFNVRAVGKVASKSAPEAVVDPAGDGRCDYILGGQLLAFEFVNEEGLWSVTSRRTATINLNLFRSGAREPVIDTVITETDREGEGMGVMHSTNVEKLMKRVFKKVAQQIIDQTSRGIAGPPAQNRK